LGVLRGGRRGTSRSRQSPGQSRRPSCGLSCLRVKKHSDTGTVAKEAGPVQPVMSFCDATRRVGFPLVRRSRGS
jgi:hypothetical protein